MPKRMLLSRSDLIAQHQRALKGARLFLGCMLLSCMVSVQAAKPDIAAKSEQSKAELESLQNRIESLKQELDSTQTAHHEAADALKESEAAISETNRKLFELNQQHQANRNTLQNLQGEKSTLETTITKQQKLLSSQLYQQYLKGNQGYIQVVLEQRDPNAIARELRYYFYVSQARVKLIAALRKNLGHVATLNEQTAATLEALQTLKDTQEKERDALKAQQNERKQTLNKLATQIQAQRGEISKLVRDEKNLTNLVDRLAKLIAAKLKPAPIRNKKPAIIKETPDTKPDTETTVARNEELPTDTLKGAFAALKGKLRLPVIGDIANRFGAQREETGVSWKGLFIRANEGTEVKSVANGRVVFADWMRGFGNLMILDHGDGFMSLYGNNQSLLHKVGEEVKAGDTIANVGNTGGNAQNGLYFELRHLSKPFDPLSWCVVK